MHETSTNNKTWNFKTNQYKHNVQQYKNNTKATYKKHYKSNAKTAWNIIIETIQTAQNTKAQRKTIKPTPKTYLKTMEKQSNRLYK